MMEYRPRQRESPGPLPPGLSESVAHRIDQQIKRVYRRTYNAESGLRTLVQLGVAAMIRAGATPQQIRHALVARIDRNIGEGKDSILTGKSHSETLKNLVAVWCDEACEQLSAEQAK